MIKDYSIDKLEAAVRHRFEQNGKAFRVDKLFEEFDAVNQPEKQKILNHLDDLQTKRRVKLTQVTMVTFRQDVIEAERRREELRTRGAAKDFYREDGREQPGKESRTAAKVSE